MSSAAIWCCAHVDRLYQPLNVDRHYLCRETPAGDRLPYLFWLALCVLLYDFLPAVSVSWPFKPGRAMNFTKTTLAVALGIILAPLLLMFLTCGGCITLLGIGAGGTALAPAEPRPSEPERPGARTTATTSAGRGTGGDAPVSTGQFESPRAHAIHADDKARFAQETESRETIIAEHKKQEDATAELVAWKAENPEPALPELETRIWKAVLGDYSVEGVLVDADDVTATIRRSDNDREVAVPIEKLAAESRVYAQDHAESFATHRKWQAALAEIGAAIAAIEVPEMPPAPQPAMTVVQANEQAKREAEAEKAAREAEEQNRPKMTMVNYNRCRPGMTYDEVIAIVGSPSEVLSENQIADIHTIMYSWNAGFLANANMTFQDGKLVSKAQLGL